MTEKITTPKAVKSISEAKERVKNRDRKKITENTKKINKWAWLKDYGL